MGAPRRDWLVCVIVVAPTLSKSRAETACCFHNLPRAQEEAVGIFTLQRGGLLGSLAVATGTCSIPRAAAFARAQQRLRDSGSVSVSLDLHSFWTYTTPLGGERVALG